MKKDFILLAALMDALLSSCDERMSFDSMVEDAIKESEEEKK